MIEDGRTCAYQAVRNVSFLENVVYILDKWSLDLFEKTVYGFKLI